MRKLRRRLYAYLNGWIHMENPRIEKGQFSAYVAVNERHPVYRLLILREMLRHVGLEVFWGDRLLFRIGSRAE